jgi:hypothetical protein
VLSLAIVCIIVFTRSYTTPKPNQVGQLSFALPRSGFIPIADGDASERCVKFA